MRFTCAAILPKLSGTTNLLKYHTNKGLPKQYHLHLAKSILDVLGANYSSFLSMTIVESFPIIMLVACPFLLVVFDLNTEAPTRVASSQITSISGFFVATERFRTVMQGNCIHAVTLGID